MLITPHVLTLGAVLGFVILVDLEPGLVHRLQHSVRSVLRRELHPTGDVVLHEFVVERQHGAVLAPQHVVADA